jgi:hypothetical protein
MPYILNDPLYPGADYRVTFPRITGAQVVTLSGTGLGGTFVLSYKGQKTGAIAYNASAAAVQSALEVVTGIGVGNIAVTGSAGGPWTIAPLHPLDPNLFTTPRLSYDLTNITGTNKSMSVTLEPKNTTGFTYFLQARSNPPLPVTPNIQIDAAHTTQGSFVNHGASGLIDLTILGSAIESLDFRYGSPLNANTTAQYIILENDGTNMTEMVIGSYTLQGKVYQ